MTAGASPKLAPELDVFKKKVRAFYIIYIGFTPLDAR